ncbi:MAG: endopeptidase La [Gammaproteobacteria bacterium]
MKEEDKSLSEQDRGSSRGPHATGEDTRESHTQLVLPGDALPTTLHLLPLSERPFFPGQVMPILVSEEQWLETVKRVGEMPHHMAGLVLLQGDAKEARPANFYSIGTVVRMHNPGRQHGQIQFMAEGVERFRIHEWVTQEAPFVAQVEYPPTLKEDDNTLKAYGVAIINTIKELLPLNPLYAEELKVFLSRFSPNEPSPFADFAANLTTAGKEELQDVLETVPVLPRMEKVLVLIKKELQVARIQAEIRKGVQDRISDQQRKFFLKEQLKEIQRELGISKDDRTAQLDRFRERLQTLHVPEGAKKQIDDEMEKLSVLEVGSPEYAVTRNYLDWVTSLPWGIYSEEKLDLKIARAVLDRDHDGLGDVKDRIIEFLAVGVLKGEVTGSILLLVGPPGVGKTSIGRSIADALGRKFYRFSLGGMRDEAEIKGHRRTYIGAMPGKFIQAMKSLGVANPVLMLDEIDKIGASYHGDPASALLEVLDPEQNTDFLDHYLDMRFDLSRVLFICTANQLDTIPGPLLDRMETIRLAGYVTNEKVEIARHHLWPKQLARAGVKRSQVRITDAALRHIIEGYAREAGVRNLEKQLGRIVRKAVVELLEGTPPPLRTGIKEVEAHLGKPMFRQDRPLTGVGIVTGLAWTPLGGATLDIEASRVHEKHRELKLTGKLGEVMRESAEIAYSYIASNVETFHGQPAFFDDASVHLHVPEGATPKDGPSAGITMATALLSLARGERIKRPMAMTGELTLTGRVLPVGGIREKVIAARRSKLMELILPEANRRDFDELPEYLRKGLNVHFVRRYPEVQAIAFPT